MCYVVAYPVRATRMRGFVALSRACHPLPSVAVTAFAVVLAVTAGVGTGTCGTLALAVLAGQLSVGWSNDRIDAPRDRHNARTDKPLATGELALGTADVAIAIAVIVTVVASLAVGWRAGLAHLGAVACAWAYNAGLKATRLSWLPYAVAFGAMPAVATLARADHAAPTWWAVAAAALLGVGAHLANALPDLLADRATGVVGLPHRLGTRGSATAGALALVAGSAVLVLGPGTPGALRLAGLAVAAALTLGGLVVARACPASPWLFRGTVAIAALDAVLLVLGPSFVAR